MKQIFTTLLLSFITSLLWAQSGTIKGVLINQSNQLPIANMDIELLELKTVHFTDDDGSFVFSNVPYGSYRLQIGDGVAVSEIIQVQVKEDVVDLGQLNVQVSNNTNTSGISNGSGLSEMTLDSDDDGVSVSNFSPILNASRDPFINAANFTFGSLRYQLRGYFRNEQEVYMNGVPMNDLETGNAVWGIWGGLNDVFRNQTNAYFLNPGEDGFGGLLGTTSINATASSLSKQTRITYSNSNRSYRNRVMITHNTGILENGWAFSVSASKRWAKEGYIPGTFYDAYSYFLSASKKIGTKSFLHFTTFGAPSARGKAGPSTQEAMDLAGSNYYNPNWGYQDGVKRNAKIANSFLPTGILSYEYKRSPLEQWLLSASYQQGYYSNSGLDWYNAQDPRPDYYRKLPSYYIYDPKGVDSNAYEEVLADLTAHPEQLQLDWNRLYEANNFNTITVNGVTGKRSVYAVGADVDETKRFSLAANYKRVVSDDLKIFGGAVYQLQLMESYKKMIDLLGGDFWVNNNQFAERTFIGNTDYNQNDLNHPDQIIREGDKYGYDYKSTFHNVFALGQATYTHNRFNFFLAAKLGYEMFQRNGLYKSGLFQDDSYGNSAMQKFFTYAAKAGATFQIDGRNFLFLNGAYITNAPSFDNTFISPRVRNITVDNPKIGSSMTVEGGYILHSPYFNGRLTGFATQYNDQSNILRFYHDQYRTFVNYAMTDISIRNLGLEFALQAKISPSLSATAVAVWNQAFYTNRPTVSVFRDNDTILTPESTTSYMKNYYAASGPQSAYTLGLNYRSPQYWYINVNFNYLDRNYLAVNPVRLTEEATELMDRNSAQFQEIVAQEKLPAFYTIDIFGGKSFMLNKYFKKIPRSHMLYFNVGINNITNNKNVMTGGFNQLRFDMDSRDPDRFQPKYFYGLGINYFVNISYKF